MNYVPLHMNDRQTIALCFSAFFFASCGSYTPPAPHEAQVADAIDEETPICTKKFISEFNSIEMALSKAKFDPELELLSKQISDFSEKYPDTVCTAKRKKTHTSFTIDAATKVEEWNKVIAALENQLTPDTSEPITD